MGVRTFSTYNQTDTPLVTVAETVVATLAGVSTNQPGQTVALKGQVTMTSGTSTTGVTLRIRRDGIAGAVVGEPPADTLFGAVGTVETHDVYAEDSSAGEFSGRSYVLTVQQTAASANGNVLTASLVADVTP
jgi:hypothetical protein